MLNFFNREKRRQNRKENERKSVRLAESQKVAQGDEEAALEPEFPTLNEAQAIHDQSLIDHGQPAAHLINPDWLESALGRAANYWYYGEGSPEEKMADAAGALAHGVGAAQAFEDGNKRTAYHTARYFLHNNGYGHLSPVEHDDEELADHLLGHGAGTHSLEDTQALFRSRMPNQRHSNILDPIHDALDPRVWDDPASPEPTLKPEHTQYIHEKVFKVLEDNGYDGMERWLSLVFTGSLTTYQYSDDSDADISLFVDVKKFPEWSRAEMIGLMIHNVDGTTLPGTPFPLQCFVVPPTETKQDLYKPGLRSGYDMATDTWIVPPDKNRIHDVENEMNEAYTIALENADKMDRLLRYEPDKAVQFWHQIHKRRRRDQTKGRGDYSPSNITYKMLANRGLFPKIEEVSGEYLAKRLAMANGVFYHVAPSQHRQAIEREGLVPSEDAPSSPWADVRWNRAGQPSGVYLWDDPMNAVGYAYNLEGMAGGGEYPGDKDEYDMPDYERYMEGYQGDPEDDDAWTEYSDQYKPSPLYDIWKVDARGLPVDLDPEMALRDGPLTADEAQEEINHERQKYGEPERLEGHRWYIPHAVSPERLSLHEQLYPQDMTMRDAEDAMAEGKQIPAAWHRVPLDEWNEKARKRYLGKVGSDEDGYNGWTNWDTWTAKMLMDEEYEHYQMQKKMAEESHTPEQIRDWAIPNVIAPYNQERMQEARDWNETPEEDRTDHIYDDLKEKNPQAADLVDQLGFGRDVSDEMPELIDPELVNWDEIHHNIMTGYEEEKRHEEGKDPLWKEPQPDPDKPGDFTLPPNWAKRKAHYENQLQQIAESYNQAPVYQPEAHAAWEELAADSKRRADQIRQQYNYRVTDDPEPYANGQEMLEDIRRGNFVVSRANSEHPIWTPEQNVDFRTVHDVLGHGTSGGDFSWEGENQACAAHAPLLSPAAQKALFTECIAQTAAANYNGGFGPQKTAFLPQVQIQPYRLGKEGDGTFCHRHIRSMGRTH